MMAEFKRATDGRWYGILGTYGIDHSFLRNVHGPCPLCGGKDRFRWDDKDGSGSYFCSGCGAGNGLTLLKKYTGKNAMSLVNEIQPKADSYKAVPVKPAADGSARIKSVLKESRVLSSFRGGVVRKYLKSRGLKSSPFLMEHAGLKYYHHNGDLLGVYPAMVSPLRNKNGIVTLHVTYLTSDGEKAPVTNVKKLLTPVGDMAGASIVLTKQYEHLGIAEGIETALAVMELHNMPCWAAANAGLLEKFLPPEGTTQVTIYSDNDSNFAGQRSAYILANSLSKKGIKVDVVIPKLVGDFADEIAG